MHASLIPLFGCVFLLCIVLFLVELTLYFAWIICPSLFGYTSRFYYFLDHTAVHLFVGYPTFFYSHLAWVT